MSRVVIGFSHSKKKFAIMSWGIIWFDRIIYGRTSNVSHAYVKFTASIWERDLYYQASGHATNFMGQSHFLEVHEPMEEYEMNIPNETLIAIGRTCVDREGGSYGVMQSLGTLLVFFVFMITFKKLRIKNPFKNGTNCVEEVGRILIGSGLKLPTPSFDMDTISPKPFRDWVSSFSMSKRVL